MKAMTFLTSKNVMNIKKAKRMTFLLTRNNLNRIKKSSEEKRKYLHLMIIQLRGPSSERCLTARKTHNGSINSGNGF